MKILLLCKFFWAVACLGGKYATIKEEGKEVKEEVEKEEESDWQ